MLSISNFKEMAKTDFQITELDSLFHTVYFKNHQGLYLGANQVLLHFFGYDNFRQLCYKNDKMLDHDQKTLQTVLDNDAQVVQQKKPSIFIENAQFQDKRKSFLSFKVPFYESAHLTGIAGISFDLAELTLKDIFELNLLITDKFKIDFGQIKLSDLCAPSNKPVNREDELTFNIKQQKLKLTPRELECIKLSIQGNSAKMIAEKLGLSNRTVEYYLNNIRNKANCRTRYELNILFSPYFI